MNWGELGRVSNGGQIAVLQGRSTNNYSRVEGHRACGLCRSSAGFS